MLKKISIFLSEKNSLNSDDQITIPPFKYLFFFLVNSVLLIPQNLKQTRFKKYLFQSFITRKKISLYVYCSMYNG